MTILKETWVKSQKTTIEMYNGEEFFYSSDDSDSENYYDCTSFCDNLQYREDYSFIKVNDNKYVKQKDIKSFKVVEDAYLLEFEVTYKDYGGFFGLGSDFKRTKKLISKKELK